MRVSDGQNRPMKDGREFQRIDISIPCMVFCDDEIITGEVTNLSLSGAFISQASKTLPEGSAVTLMLQKKQDIKLKATVDSKIIHSFQEVREDDQINSFGVKFKESSSEVTDKLAFILDE